MASRHRKSWSTSRIIKEIQTQNTMRYYFTSIGYYQKDKRWLVGENVGKREPLYAVGGNVNGTATMENSMDTPYKTKNRITIWSSNPTSGCISEGNTITILKRELYSHVHCSIIHNSQDMETT